MIKEHLQALQKLAPNEYYAYMLKNGADYTDKTISAKIVSTTVRQKECFKNSLLASLIDWVDYVEGFYVTEFDFPMEHAWNVDKSGAVIDSTAREFNIKVKERFGVVVPRAVLLDYLETDQYLTALQFYFRNYVCK